MNVVAAFDRRIKSTLISGDAYAIQLAKIDKQLFLKSCQLDVHDWRVIRDPQFWKESDALPCELSKKKLLLSSIVAYQKQNEDGKQKIG